MQRFAPFSYLFIFELINLTVSVDWTVELLGQKRVLSLHEATGQQFEVVVSAYLLGGGHFQHKYES